MDILKPLLVIFVALAYMVFSFTTMIYAILATTGALQTCLVVLVVINILQVGYVSGKAFSIRS